MTSKILSIYLMNTLMTSLLMTYAFSDHVQHFTGCRTAEVELVFAIDGELINNRDDLTIVQKLIKDVIAAYDVNAFATRIAVVIIRDPPTTLFELDDHNDIDSIQYAIDCIKPSTADGGRQLGRLFRHIRRDVISGARDTSSRFVLVITKGASSDDAIQSAHALRTSGVHTIGIIVNDQITNDHYDVSSSDMWSKLITVSEVSEISDISGIIHDEVCANIVQGCPTTKHDIAFMIDVGSTFTAKKLKRVKSWMKMFVASYNTAKNMTQFAAVYFTNRNEYQDFKFHDFYGQDEIFSAIDDFQFKPGYRRTYNALNHLQTITFEHGYGSRHEASRAVVMITDGMNYDKYSGNDAVDTLKSAAVDIYVVGIDDFDMEELNNIASNPNAMHVYTNPDYGDIFPISTKITNEICRKSQLSCPEAAVDIVFLVDGNLGLEDMAMTQAKLLIKRISDSFKIGEQFVRVAMVKYGSEPSLMFSLSAHDNINDVLHGIDKLTPQFDQPHMGAAIEYSVVNVLGDARGGVSKYIVLLGYGSTHDDVTDAIALAKEENIGVFAYEIGLDTNDSILKVVSGNRDHLAHGNTMKDLAWQDNLAVAQICKQSEPVCKDHEVDIHFLVDGSVRMTEEKFNRAKEWIMTTINSFDIGRYRTRIGLSQFSSKVHTEFLFGAYKTNEEIQHAVSQFKYRGIGKPKLGKALKYTTNYIFTLHGGAREGTPKILVVISDTHSEDDIDNSLRKIKDAGIKTFIVGSAGFNVSIADLLTNETGGNHVIEEDFESINLVRKDLVNNICTQTHFDGKGGTCPEVEMDLIFLIDGSTSIKPGNFEHAKEWMISFIKEFEIGDYNSNIGVIQYTGDPYMEVNVTKFTNKSELISAVNQITYRTGGTRTGAALEFAREYGFSKIESGRSKAPKVIIVLTDGESQDNVIPPATLLRKEGVILYAVGVGDEIDRKELEYIASTPISSSVYHVKNYKSVFSIKSSLVRRVCQKVETDCKETATDMVIVVDGSNSVGYEDWEIVKSFMRNITERFTIGPDTVRVGVIQYATYPKTEFTMKDNQNITSLAEAIDRIEWMKGDTHTAQALRYARSEGITTLAGARGQEVPKIMIVVTDGDPQDSLEVPAAAEAIHDDGWRVFAIGVGQATISELNVIATDPDQDHVFYADNFEDTRKLKGRLFRMICSDYELIVRPKTPNGSKIVKKNSTDPISDPEADLITSVIDVHDLQDVTMDDIGDGNNIVNPNVNIDDNSNPFDHFGNNTNDRKHRKKPRRPYGHSKINGRPKKNKDRKINNQNKKNTDPNDFDDPKNSINSDPKNNDDLTDLHDDPDNNNNDDGDNLDDHSNDPGDPIGSKDDKDLNNGDPIDENSPPGGNDTTTSNDPIDEDFDLQNKNKTGSENDKNSTDNKAGDNPDTNDSDQDSDGEDEDTDDSDDGETTSNEESPDFNYWTTPQIDGDDINDSSTPHVDDSEDEFNTGSPPGEDDKNKNTNQNDLDDKPNESSDYNTEVDPSPDNEDSLDELPDDSKDDKKDSYPDDEVNITGHFPIPEHILKKLGKPTRGTPPDPQATDVPEVMVRSFKAQTCPTTTQYNGEELKGWDLLQEFDIIRMNDVTVKPKRSIVVQHSRDATHGRSRLKTIKVVKGTKNELSYRISPMHEIQRIIHPNMITSLRDDFSISMLMKLNGKVQKEYLTLLKVNDNNDDYVIVLALDGINNEFVVTLPTDDGKRTVKFKDGENISILFNKKYHKLNLAYKHNSLSLFVDCNEIGKFDNVSIGERRNPPYTASLLLSSNSVRPSRLFVDMQEFKLRCDTSDVENCCAISGEKCPAKPKKENQEPEHCVCPPGPRGPPGQIPQDILEKLDIFNKTATPVNYCLENTSFQSLLQEETRKAVKGEMKTIVKKLLSSITDNGIDFTRLQTELQDYLL